MLGMHFRGFTLLALILFALQARAQDATETVDTFFGHLGYFLTGNSCTDGTRDEYDYLSCTLNVHTSNIGQLQDFSAVNNATIFTAAGSDVYHMNKCQVDFFDLYKNNSEEKADLETRAFEQYRAVRQEVFKTDARIHDRTMEMVDEMQAAPCMSSQDCIPFALAAEDRGNRDMRYDRDKLNKLIRSVPMGNRPEMRTFLIRAAEQNLGEADFKKGFEEVMGTLQSQAKTSFDYVAGMSNITPTENGSTVYSMKMNADGAGDFRRSLLSNGIVHNVFLENNMEDRLKDGLICRLHRDYEVGSRIRIGAEIAATLLVPYAGAALALRAGIVAARAGSAIVRGGALVTQKLVPAVLFGAGFTEGMINWREFEAQCVNYPEYMASKSAEGCSAEKQMLEIKMESSLAACALNVSLGIGLPLAGVRTITMARRAERAALQATEEAATEAAPAAVIVVTAPRSRRRPSSRPSRTPPRQTEETVLEEYASRTVTTPEQNGRFAELARATNTQAGVVFVDAQNSMLKWLNDNLKNKNLVDALNNRHSVMLQEAIEGLKAKFPGLKIETYSDYKGIRFAVTGKAGEEAKLTRELQKITADVDRRFQQELVRNEYVSVQGRAREKNWFSTGVGETADLANIEARTGRTQAQIKDDWAALRTQRQELEAAFGSTPLMRAVDGEVSAKIPTAEVFELLRKNSDNAEVAGILRHRHGVELTPEGVAGFRAYAEGADFFSPGLLISKRVEHNFDNATHGAITLDFGGVGSLNAEATAEGLAQGFSLKRSVMNVRRNERDIITPYLDQVKRETEAAVEAVFERHSMSATITTSGDDMVIIPSGPVSEAMKVELLAAQRGAQESLLASTGRNTNVRVSFVRPNIAVKEDRAILAAEGEGIEKILRNRLEFSFTQAELRGLTFSTDMQGMARGQGGVRLLIGGSELSPERRAQIAQEFTAAVQEANTKYGSSFTPEP